MAAGPDTGPARARGLPVVVTAVTTVSRVRPFPRLRVAAACSGPQSILWSAGSRDMGNRERGSVFVAWVLMPSLASGCRVRNDRGSMAALTSRAKSAAWPAMMIMDRDAGGFNLHFISLVGRISTENARAGRPRTIVNGNPESRACHGRCTLESGGLLFQKFSFN